jgi:hypothetical protein
MTTRPRWFALGEGVVEEVEAAAATANALADPYRATPSTATWPCGHRRTTACRFDRCTVLRPFT